MPKTSSTGFGQATQMFWHARDLRRNGGHDQRRGQRVAARRDVRADGVERAHDLAELGGRARSCRYVARQLLFGEAADIGRRRLRRRQRNSGVRRSAAAASSRTGTRTDLRFEAVELARVFEERFVAALADGFEDRAHGGFGFGEARRAAGEQPADSFEFENADHC